MTAAALAAGASPGPLQFAPVGGGEVAATVAFALSVGVVTFFAPCAYPLLPGYVGYYVSQDDATLAGATVRGLAAAAGALVTLSALAAVILTAGQAVVARITELEPVIGAGLVGLGVLMLAGRAPEVRVLLPERRSSIPGFAVFGAVYAIAAAGCVVPAFVGVITQSLALPPAGAAVALASYAAAVAVPLAGVTLLAGLGSGLVRRASRYVGPMQRAAGVLLVVAGLWQVWRSITFLGWV
jgi:cytochrome c-type biogenesis protein